MFVLVPFEAEVLGALGFASQDQDNLLLGSGVISFLRLKISLAFSERFEFLGSWDLRPPGVMSCLPSEGAGSGARPHLLSVPELCRYLAESWLTFQIHLQELLQYKKQNPAQVISSTSYSSSLHYEEIVGRSDLYSLEAEGRDLVPP